MNTPLMQGAAANWPARTFRIGPKFSVLFISGMAGAVIPLILSLYWIAFSLAPESLGTFLRTSTLAASAFLASIWYRAPISHAEVNLVRVLAAAAVLWFLPVLTATDPAHAFAGWIKLLILFAVCCFVARGLRHPATSHLFGLALLAGGVILAAFILFTFVRYFGFTFPGYKAAREFKGIAQLEGIPLNSVAFSAVFSYFSGLCLIRTNRLLILLAIPLLLISSVFTGSRAPLVILAVSAVVVIFINALRYKSVFLRVATVLVVASVAWAGAVLVINTSDRDLSTVTEGRSRLWPVGLEKFAERPLFGYGYESWRDDLVSRLPGENALTFDLAKSLGGGYHNEYISVLAEEGLFGLLAAGLIIWLLVRSSWLLAFRTWTSVQPGQWPLFAAIFLLLRANVEVPGLFGYAQDPADYLAYILLAIVISRFSQEEDFARLLAHRQEPAL